MIFSPIVSSGSLLLNYSFVKQLPSYATYCTQTYWTILTLQGCLLLPKKYAAIISGSLNRRACLAWCTVKILLFSSFPSSRSKTLSLLLRRKTTLWYILLTKHMVQDIGQRTLLRADWSFSCPWFIVISAQEYQKRNLWSLRHLF